MSITQALRHPDELRPNGWNSNVVSPENEAKLDASLERLGLFKAVICRRVPGTHPELEILGGEHRWASAKRLGLAEILVVDVGVIDDERAKEISLVDNARYGLDDTARLADIFSSLTDASLLSAFLPYSDDDVASTLESAAIDLDDLAIDEAFDAKAPAEHEAPAVKAPRTTTVMRFKVPLKDADAIAQLIDRVQKRHGYTEADALTNAGDALVHLLADLSSDEAAA